MMTLPVSSYEELLARVRSLTCETIQLRREITSSLCDQPLSGSDNLGVDNFNYPKDCTTLLHRTSSPSEGRDTHPNHNLGTFGSTGEISKRRTSLSDKKDEFDIELKEIDERHGSPDTPVEKTSQHRIGWGTDNLSLWHSGPSTLGLGQQINNIAAHQDLSSSVSYNTNECHSLSSSSSSSKRTYSHQQLGAKVEMVYSLLSMLDTDNREDMSKTFLAMSSSPESCHAMRQSGCLPLLIQLIHSSELDKEVRNRAAEALHNIVHSQSDEKRRRREMRVLKLLQQIREYCDEIKVTSGQENSFVLDSEKHPITAMGTVMKLSFDAEHRQAICTLGGLHAIAELIQMDHEAHGSTNDDALCITLRRYAGMSLTNLTFGDGKNKALLCSFAKFMRALVDQVKSPSEDLRQVTASVLRNLSWRADSESKLALRQVGAVTALTISAMEGKKESTLKSILSALWNLSAHCSLNKIDICSVPGALAFLVKMLRYKSASNTLAIVENAGGILRNISSHIAVREDYRQILRDHNCFEVLLEHLKSPSLTIVSNACGTLWNLSARCSEDQRKLWEMGATTMLRSLVQSKHKMISMGSSAALKNLLAANPNENLLTHLDSTAKSLGLQNLPTLFVRKQRALEQELNITLAETCDNIEPNGSPTHTKPEEKSMGPKRSDSRDSVMSSQSDSVYERINQMVHKNDEKLFENKSGALHESLEEKLSLRQAEDQKLMRRFKTSMIPTPKFKKTNQDKNEKTKEDSPTLEEEALEKVSVEANFKNGGLDAKDKTKKGIPVLKMRPKNKILAGHESTNHQKSFLNNLSGPCIEKCSQKYNELESLNGSEGENPGTESVARKLDVLNINISHDPVEEDELKSQNVSHEENLDTKCDLRASGVGSSHRFEGNQQNEIGLLENLLTDSVDGSKHSVLNKKDGRRVNVSPREVPSKQNKENSSEDSFLRNKINSEDCKKETEVSFPSTSNPDRLEVDSNPYPVDNAEEVIKVTNRKPQSESHFVRETLTSEGVTGAGSDVNLNEETPVQDSKTFHWNRFEVGLAPNQTAPQGVTSKETLNRGGFESKEETARDMEVAVTKPDGKSSNHIKSSDLLKQCLNDTNNFVNMIDSERSELYNKICTESSLSKGRSDLTADEEAPAIVSGDDETAKKSSNCIVPNFKIGSQITDAKVLQMEANKICREIQRHQDIEMGCSLTSEVSLVSCSSFLDTGDYSIFELSSEGIDFDESESQNLGKNLSKVKNFPFRKPNAFQTPESVSLPSLGSLKNEQIEAMDLDSSVISVASIASEIADTYVKDLDGFNTYTKTYRNDSPTECLDDGDETLNVDLLQNNSELFDDDSSLHSQENLPLDSEGFQGVNTEDVSSNQPKKRLTPKEKRKTFHERYRTYTIRDLKTSNPSAVTEVISEQERNDVNFTGPSQGIENADRNQYYNQNFNLYHESDAIENPDGRSEPGFQTWDSPYPQNKHEVLKFSKSFDREQDRISTLISDSKSLNNLLSIGPAERKELVDNARLVALTLKTAVHDFESDFTLDSEMDDTERSAPIDTATYSKNSGRYTHGKFSTTGFEDLPKAEECVPDEDIERKGPRILKPDENFQEQITEEHLKGIRGRRKQLYSSPLKPLRVSSSSPHKVSQTADVKKVSPNTSKDFQPVLLQREGTFTKEEGTSLKKPEVKTGRGIPVLSRNSESKPSALPKPGIRNKSAPAVGTSRRASEVPRPTRPHSTYSKNGERRSDSDAGLRRPSSTGAGTRMSGDGAKRHSSVGSATHNARSSSIGQVIRSSSSSTNVSNVKSRSPASSSPISKSDASLNVTSSKDKGKKATPKKEVTSKIASLWRKVEETKQKNKNVKDSRVWIGPEKNVPVCDEVLVIEQEEIVDIPTRKIVHSYTCQGLAEEG